MLIIAEGTIYRNPFLIAKVVYAWFPQLFFGLIPKQFYPKNGSNRGKVGLNYLKSKSKLILMPIFVSKSQNRFFGQNGDSKFLKKNASIFKKVGISIMFFRRYFDIVSYNYNCMLATGWKPEIAEKVLFTIFASFLS